MNNTQKSVTVYSTTSCPFCYMVKDFLIEKGISFKDVDVGSDREAAMEMVRKSGQMGVPVIDVGGEIVVGFRPDVLEGLLG